MATELGHVYREHVTPIWRYVRGQAALRWFDHRALRRGDPGRSSEGKT